LQRRLLRYAAGKLGAAPDFAATEALRVLALAGRAGQRCELAQGLRAERTQRELRLGLEGVSAAGAGEAAVPEYEVGIPGEVEAAGFGLRLRVEVDAAALGGCAPGSGGGDSGRMARLRNWRAGDRVRLRYSSGPRKVKEVLERLRVTGSGRAIWPVLEVDGRIVWMQGAELEPEAGIRVAASPLKESDA